MKENPFFDNHLFKKEDLERTNITWRDKLWLWLFPTKVQLTEIGVFFYKNVGGSYYLMNIEKMRKLFNQVKNDSKKIEVFPPLKLCKYCQWNAAITEDIFCSDMCRMKYIEDHPLSHEAYKSSVFYKD